MNVSKLTSGSGAEVLDKTSQTPPKSAQRNAARAAAKKVSKKATGYKTKTNRPQVKAARSSISAEIVCRYCGSDDLAPSFIKRRDRRCRKCFSKRYGSAAQTRKTKAKK
jgi:ribosomal protein L40E